MKETKKTFTGNEVSDILDSFLNIVKFTMKMEAQDYEVWAEDSRASQIVLKALGRVKYEYTDRHESWISSNRDTFVKEDK